MGLTISTAPGEMPVSVNDAKLHLRLDAADEDAQIAGLIAAATEYAEIYTGRRFVTQTWKYYLDQFPAGALIRMPYPPLSSVTSIGYTDTAGSGQTVDSGDYTVDTDSEPGRIVPAVSATWPATQDVVNAVTVTFVCGYGDPEDVPDGLKAAIKFLVNHWYEQREPIVIGASIRDVPMNVQALLWQFRVW